MTGALISQISVFLWLIWQPNLDRIKVSIESSYIYLAFETFQEAVPLLAFRILKKFGKLLYDSKGL